MKTHTLIASILLVFSFSAFSADDPSIKGELRTQVQSSMNQYIANNAVGDSIYLYDAVEGQLLKLKLKELHSGIVKKGDFYVSCADFVDQHNRKVDIDFMVIRKETKNFVASQALIHSINGKKRKYHLEKL